MANALKMGKDVHSAPTALKEATETKNQATVK